MMMMMIIIAIIIQHLCKFLVNLNFRLCFSCVSCTYLVITLKYLVSIVTNVNKYFIQAEA